MRKLPLLLAAIMLICCTGLTGALAEDIAQTDYLYHADH